MILFLLAVLAQDRVLGLDQRYDRIAFHDRGVYLTRRFAKGIAFYPDSGSPDFMTITDEENFRIDGFQVTPFVFYLNRGADLIRFFPVSGSMDTFYSTREISAFSVTADGNAVIADRPNNALVFLDSRGQPQFTVNQVAVQDLVFRRDTLYALAGRELLVYDRFGNPVRKLDVPEILDRVAASDSALALFGVGRSYYYWYDDGWVKIDLPFDLSDLVFDGRGAIILGNHGSTLYFYRPADR